MISADSVINDNDITSRGIAAITILFLFAVLSLIVAGDIPQTEDAGELLFLLFGGLAVSIFVFYLGFVKRKELGLIKNTPTSKIRSLPMGNVEIKGSARPGAEDMCFESPFSGKKCLFYKYEIQEYRQLEDDNQWETIDSGFEAKRFLVEDETGAVIVDPESADFEFPSNEFKVDNTDSANEHIKEFIKEHDIGRAGGIIGENDRKYIEWFIEPGENVYVFGYASNERDEQGEYTVIKDNPAQEMFMISDKSEKELVKGKKWRSRGYLFAGATGALSIYSLLLFFLRIL
jgi:hypothetical protein